MSGSRDSREHESRPPVRYTSDYPNYPEVSGTSLPLLSMVLAGFAVTAIVQIAMRPDVTEDLATRVVLSLVCLLLSTLFLLCATVFAIKAQANNYLPFLGLGEREERLLEVGDTREWISRLERVWYIYHTAAIYLFYTGVVLLLAGLNLIVWHYVGATVAAVMLAATLAVIAVVIAVDAVLLLGLRPRGRR